MRGPNSERANLYYFLEDFVTIVEQVVESVCPGLCVERYTLSPSQLREHGKVVRSYSPTELLRMQLENRSSVVLSGNSKEDFIDIACLGSEEILETVTLGMDLPISHLTVHTQRLLSLLLDPPEPLGKDWCLLAVQLGLSEEIPAVETGQSDGNSISHTQKVSVGRLSYSLHSPSSCFGSSSSSSDILTIAVAECLDHLLQKQ